MLSHRNHFSFRLQLSLANKPKARDHSLPTRESGHELKVIAAKDAVGKRNGF